MEIGPQLREIRLAADMSQRALAGRSGVANATISQIEAGHINPTVATLESILSGLSMDLATFFGDAAADDASAAPRRSEKLLEDAIDSLNEGFVLFDAEDRLVTCNDVYRGMFPHLADVLNPGVSFGEMIEHAITQGFHERQGMDAEEFRKTRFDAHRNPGDKPFVQQSDDGRWVLSHEVRTHGGSMVGIRTDITELKLAETAHRESEERFKDLASVASDWFWETDENDCFTYISERFYEVMHVRPEDILGKSRRQFSGSEEQEADADKWHRHFDDLDAHRPFRGLEYVITGADGIARHISVNGVPIVDGSGRFLGYRGADTDITDRRNAEEQLRVALDNMPGGIRLTDKDRNYIFFNEQYRELYGFPEGLLKVGESVRVENLYQAKRGDFGSGDPEKLTDKWLAKHPVKTEAASWERTTPDGKILRVYTAPTPDGGVVNIATDITDVKKAEEDLAKNEALLSTALDNMSDGIFVLDTDQRFVMFNERYIELIEVPSELVEVGKPVYDVALQIGKAGRHGSGSAEDYARERTAHFASEDFFNAETVTPGGRVLDVRKAPLKNGGAVVTFTDVTERRLAEEKNRVTFENAAVGIAEVDLDGTFLRVNDRYCRFLGYEPGELVGRASRDVTAPDYLEGTEERARQLKTGEVETIVAEKKYLRKDGTTVWGNLCVSLIRDADGKPAYRTTFLVDIDEGKRAKDAAAAAEVRMRDAVENISEGFAQFDADNCLVMCNSKYRDIYGYSERDTRPGTSITELLQHDISRGAVDKDTGGEDITRRRIAKFGKTEETFDVPLADGRWVQIRDRQTDDGGTVSIHTDISERKQAEEFQRSILESIPIPLSVVRESDGLFLYCNQPAAALAGCAPEDMVGISAVDIYWHAEDRERFSDRLQKSGRVDDFEVELKSADDEPLWAVISSRQIKFQDENAILSAWTVITDRKQAEEELAEKEAQLRIVLDNMPDGIRCFDKDNKFLFFNSRYSELWDLPDGLLKIGDYLVVENTYLAERGDYGEGDIDELVDAVMFGRPFETEPQHYERTTVKGRILDCRTQPTDDGGYVSIHTDITERKKAEEALHNSEELFRGAFESSTAGMFLQDGAGDFLQVNQTFCDLLGYTERECLQMNWRDVTHPDDLDMTLVSDEEMVSGAKDNFVLEKRYLHKDGHAVWARLFSAQLRDAEGEAQSIFCQIYAEDWD